MINILQNRAAGYLSAVLGIAAVTAILAPFHDQLINTAVALALLLVVLFVATLWGRGPGMVAAVLGMLCFNFFFLPPVHTFTIADPQNWVALAAFYITASTVGHLSVTAKRRAAEAEAGRKAARVASLYNRSLLEASLDPLVTIGRDGKITDLNIATERLIGYSRTELIGTAFSDYFTEPEKAQTGYQHVLREGLVRDYTLEIRHRDGHLIPVLYNASVYHDETGEVVGLVAAAHDITERKRAESEIRLLARLQTVVAGLGQWALRSDRYEGVLDEAVTLVAQTLDVEYCNVMELLPGGEEFLLRAGVGWKEGSVGRVTVPTRDSQSGYTVRSDRPVIVDDAATETRFIPSPRLLGEDVVSAMSVVISTGEGPYGALGAHTRRRRTFTKDEVNFLQAIANVLGSAIERHRDEAQLLRINRTNRALSRCNQVLIRATDESTLLQQICDLVVEEAGYRLCWVGQAENDEAKSVRPLAQAGFEEGYLNMLNITWADTERGRGPTGTCIRTCQPALVKNIATDPTMAPWRTEALKRGYASNIAIPLLIDSAAFGALTIYAAEPEAFGAEEVTLLTELANDLAFGITTLRTRIARARAEGALRETEKREEVRKHEIDIGFKIQKMLLLDEPPKDIPGLRVAALTIPSQRIDGDFYDFFTHENQCLDVIVADVMGKGVPAALLGAATKSHFIEALSHLMALSKNGKLPEPKEIVTLAHAEMVQQLITLENFVTLCYARFDLNKQSLDLVDCGHTGVIHFRAKTSLCEMVHGDNLPLGIREGEIYTQLSVPFAPGDVLLFYSDGVTEARNAAGELYGVERLAERVRLTCALEPDALVEAILKAVRDFAESDQLSDDLTCVAIKVAERQLPLTRAEIELRSDLTELRRAREFVRTFCRQLPGPPLPEERMAEFELAVNEAVCNIMKHAYHGRTDQWIHLEAEAFPGQVSILLHHLGEPCDPSAVPPPPLDGSRESGFGLYLITKSVDAVRYHRDERGRNCITLVKVRTP